MKLMIMGHARHGKDTACEYLRDKYGLTFKSSSEAACEAIIYPALKDIHGYKTIEECFNDRGNHRKIWYALISNYCHHNPAVLSEIIFQDHDIYCGIRSKKEFDATKAAGLFDLSIWIDASNRLPAESEDSCTVTKEDADIVISNNGTLEQLYAELDRMMLTIATPNKKNGMAI
jgi:dephospho-CoA kinase